MYHLWDKLILFNDNLMNHFIIVAFLIYKKENYIKNDISQVPSIISQLTFTSIEEVDDVINLAVDICRKTPISFRYLAERLEIFKFNSQKLKELFETFHIFQEIPAMPLLPGELLRLTNKEKVFCIDKDCYTFIPKNQKILNPNCIFCNVNNDIIDKILILDLRKKINIEDYCGGIKNSIHIDINDSNYTNSIIEAVEKYKNYHVILITSETDYFDEENTKMYKQKIREKEIITYRTHSKSKKFFVSKSKFSNINSKEYVNNAIKEFSYLKSITTFLHSKNIQYVSYLYGGYFFLHQLLVKYEMEIIMHGVKCLLCKMNTKIKKNKKNEIITSFKTFIDKKINNNYHHNAQKTQHVVKNIIKEDEIESCEKSYKCLMNEIGSAKSKKVLLLLSEGEIKFYISNDSLYEYKESIAITSLKNVYHDEKFGNVIMIYYERENEDMTYRQFLMLNMITDEKVKEILIEIGKMRNVSIKENKDI